ncbi:MAG: hypothetical protein QM305_00945 [Bacteroidota bacterium]|nr:hypothetical protein [Bacteroidota bacterium]
MYDIEARVPALFHVTPAGVNDMKVIPEIPYEKGAVYIFDRGNVCDSCQEELEVQANLVETKTSKECSIRLYYRIYRV